VHGSISCLQVQIRTGWVSFLQLRIGFQVSIFDRERERERECLSFLYRQEPDSLSREERVSLFSIEGRVAVWQCGNPAIWQSGSLAVWQPIQPGSLAAQSRSLPIWQSGNLALSSLV